MIHSIPLKYPYVYYFLVSVYANPPLLGALSHTKTYLGVGERLLGGEEDSCIWHWCRNISFLLLAITTLGSRNINSRRAWSTQKGWGVTLNPSSDSGLWLKSTAFAEADFPDPLWPRNWFRHVVSIHYKMRPDCIVFFFIYFGSISRVELAFIWWSRSFCWSMGVESSFVFHQSHYFNHNRKSWMVTQWVHRDADFVSNIFESFCSAKPVHMVIMFPISAWDTLGWHCSSSSINPSLSFSSGLPNFFTFP